LELVKAYFSEGGDVNKKTDDCFGITPLMLAIKNGSNTSTDVYNNDVIKLILSKKPNLSVKDNHGEVALHHGNCKFTVDLLVITRSLNTLLGTSEKESLE
jgi:hypothetical protein